jgi:hypothetical protein
MSQPLAIMNFILCFFFSLAVSTANALSPSPAPKGITGSFEIKADPRMADGRPWRGMEGVFVNIPFMPITGTAQTKSAPSFVLCTVSMRGDVQCPGSRGQSGDGRWISPCHLSYDCEFNDMPLPDSDIFGVIFISIGIKNTPFADAAIFTRQKFTMKSTEYLEMDARLHDVVNSLTKEKNRDELRRRERPFQMYELEYCAATPCRLRQTELKFEPN